MGQEHKQITPAEILNKLVAKTDKKGDFVAYRGEIEKLQVRMSALLSACREVAREVNAAAAKNVPQFKSPLPQLKSLLPRLPLPRPPLRRLFLLPKRRRRLPPHVPRPHSLALRARRG